MKRSGSQKSKSPSQLIDARLKELDDWRGQMLSRLRSFHEGEKINEQALKTLVRAAVILNKSTAKS